MKYLQSHAGRSKADFSSPLLAIQLLIKDLLTHGGKGQVYINVYRLGRLPFLFPPVLF